MEITTTKIYEKALTVEKGKATGLLTQLASMDIAITDLKYPGDIETLRTCLSHWNEEFMFNSMSKNKKRQDILPSPEEGLSADETTLREKVCQQVCERIECTTTKKHPISVRYIYTLILMESGYPVYYPDKSFGVFLSVIRRLRSQGYSFNWNSRVLYDAYQARITPQAVEKKISNDKPRKEARHE